MQKNKVANVKWAFSLEIGIKLNDIEPILGLIRQRPKCFRSLACDVI